MWLNNFKSSWWKVFKISGKLKIDVKRSKTRYFVEISIFAHPHTPEWPLIPTKNWKYIFENIDNSSKYRGVGWVKIEISTNYLVFERFTTIFNFSENLKTFHQELLKLLSHFHFFCIFMIFPRGSGLSYLNADLTVSLRRRKTHLFIFEKFKR